MLLLVRRELPRAVQRDLQKRVTGHLLHSRIRLLHELEQLLAHRLQEVPVRLHERRVLPYDVHDVARHHCLILLALLLLAQVQQGLEAIPYP